MGALSLASVLGLMLVGGAGFAMVESSRYDSSTEKVYDIPPGKLVRSTDPAVIARGKHLTQSLAGCAISACHGADMSGGHVSSAGPIGTEIVPNASQILIAYTDGEIDTAVSAMQAQANAIARDVESQQGPTGLADKEIIALTAYLQRLGTDIRWKRAPVQATVAPVALVPVGAPAAVPVVPQAADPAVPPAR